MQYIIITHVKMGSAIWKNVYVSEFEKENEFHYALIWVRVTVNDFRSGFVMFIIRSRLYLYHGNGWN